ncbi:hypothetical protein ACUNWD_10845 [Sunxiuqinia sp. A32]|uniref:hypothetical protein n=1 Tax=Sunxiuqinia sp. A32 TaxID=3461496 RepID=UPI004045996F
MEKKTKKQDKSSWAIGGTTLIGLGVGLIFIQTNVFIFLASLFVGIGLGLVIAPIISCKKDE